MIVHHLLVTLAVFELVGFVIFVGIKTIDYIDRRR